jgi:Rrf2 family protein
MRIVSLTAEYALRAVSHLAAAELRGEVGAQTLAQIARGSLVPEHYLSKVLQQLVKAELVVSQRGAGGGFRLVRVASEVSVYEVVQVVDPIARIFECPLGLQAHGTELCPLHKALDEAAMVIEQRFRSTSIAALVESPQALGGMGARLEGSADAGAGPCKFPLPPA